MATSLVSSLVVIAIFAAAAHSQNEQKSLSERIAFACSQRPSLSFCASNTKDTVSESSVDPAAEAAAAAAKLAHPKVVPGLQKELERLSDSPVPKHRNWLFIPNESADKRTREPADESAEVSTSRHRSSSKSAEPRLIIPPEPYKYKQEAPFRALQSRTFPVLPSDAAYGAGQVSGSDTFKAFDVQGLTDDRGLAHRPRSRSPFTKPGLWEPNPDDPHSRDPANKWWYKPESVGADWLNGQLQWGGHWAVPAAGVGGTNGQSALHFPSIGTFLGIPDDYD